MVFLSWFCVVSFGYVLCILVWVRFRICILRWNFSYDPWANVCIPLLKNLWALLLLSFYVLLFGRRNRIIVKNMFQYISVYSNRSDIFYENCEDSISVSKLRNLAYLYRATLTFPNLVLLKIPTFDKLSGTFNRNVHLHTIYPYYSESQGESFNFKTSTILPPQLPWRCPKCKPL